MGDLEDCPVCGDVYIGVCSKCGYTKYADQRGAGVLNGDGTVFPERDCDNGVCVGKAEDEHGRIITTFCKFLEGLQAPGGIGRVIIHCKPVYNGEVEQ
jgi:hypothetical protein